MKALIIIVCIILFFVLLFHIPLSIYLSYADKVLKADIKYLFFVNIHAEAGFYDGKFRVFLPGKKKKKPRRKKRCRKKDEALSEEDISSETSEEQEEATELSAEVTEETSAEESSAADEKPEEDEAHPQFEGLEITYIDEIDDIGGAEEETPEKKFIDEKIEEIEKKIDSILLLWELNKKYLFRLIGSVRIDDVLLEIMTAGRDAASAAIKYGTVNAAVWNTISFTRTFFRMTLLNVNIKCSFDEDEHTKAAGSCIIRFAPSALISNGAAMVFVTMINLKRIFPEGIGRPKKKKKK